MLTSLGNRRTLRASEIGTKDERRPSKDDDNVRVSVQKCKFWL